MNQRQINSVLNNVKHLVHGIGSDQSEIRAGLPELFSHHNHIPGNQVPPVHAAPLMIIFKIHAVNDNLRISVITEFFNVCSGDMQVITYGRFRAQPADDTDFLMHFKK